MIRLTLKMVARDDFVNKILDEVLKAVGTEESFAWYVYREEALKAGGTSNGYRVDRLDGKTEVKWAEIDIKVVEK